MRLVRIQVYARERYRAKSGMYDIRSVTLEAEVESGDYDPIGSLQQDADRALRNWIEPLQDPMLDEVQPVQPPPITEPAPTPEDALIPF